ncbi:amidohydrolase family protein [Komagataeibacter medellinensis]|uniref:Amidohydrolase family protein n=1 Tax=Komagataeibacter medellinensis TaxID=1177712 RepID=A0ABQ6VWE8_9PROT|nr:amidohydrolase family protein [Komagataeibacter medellinensis]KAB8124441.1 amidohydrolase family protein [Komagataeibacter medellinensis]
MSPRRHALIVLATGLLATHAALPACAAPARADDRPVLLRNATVIDGTGSAARPDTDILIQQGHITQVGHALPVPAHARVVELRGQTVLPGLVSDHSHVGQVSGMQNGEVNYTRANILAALAQYEHYGVLTITALGLNRSPLFDDLRHEQHAALNPGADLYGVDQGIGAPDGVPPQNMFHLGADQIFRPTSPEEARAAVDKMADEGTDLIKLWVDDFRNGVPGAHPLPKMRPVIYRAVIAQAHLRGKRVAAHIHDLSDARALVAAGVDILAHGVRDKPVDEALISAMTQQRTSYIATLDLDEANYIFAEHPEWLDDPFLSYGLSPALRQQFADPAWRHKVLAAPLTAASRKALALNMHNLLTLYRAGITIGFGTDSGATPTRIPGFAEHRELRLSIMAGLTPLQAITLATGDAARLMQLSDRGTIAPGQLADLLVVQGDPLADPRAFDRLRQVWHHGRLVPGPLPGQHQASLP